MDIRQYNLICEFEAGEADTDVEFPETSDRAFWTYALYHACMMKPGFGHGMNGQAGYSSSMYVIHLEVELDQFLAEHPEHTMNVLWLFKEYGYPAPRHEEFHLVWSNWPTRLADHEFLAQKSDTFKNLFEVLDLDTNRIVHVSDTYEEANEWLNDQFKQLEAVEE